MSTDAAANPFDPRPSAIEWTALAEDAADAIQRDVLPDVLMPDMLMPDVRRQRGNNDLEHRARDVPHVRGFASEPAIDGRALPRPLNDGLVA